VTGADGTKFRTYPGAALIGLGVRLAFEQR
jgi:hypothetical protein